MRRHLAYLRYVMAHKWYVFLACRRMRVPLWRAVIHDWTKFTFTEWGPYARQFFNADGSRRSVRDASGSYDPNRQANEFARAWIHHQRNPHHWQAWISIGDGGSLKVIAIPETYAREMVADWVGAGRAITGERDPRAWYAANVDKMKLHPDTRILVDQLVQEAAR